jgi:hypothetical protein
MKQRNNATTPAKTVVYSASCLRPAPPGRASQPVQPLLYEGGALAAQPAHGAKAREAVGQARAQPDEQIIRPARARAGSASGTGWKAAGLGRSQAVQSACRRHGSASASAGGAGCPPAGGGLPAPGAAGHQLQPEPYGPSPAAQAVHVAASTPRRLTCAAPPAASARPLCAARAGAAGWGWPPGPPAPPPRAAWQKPPAPRPPLHPWGRQER